MTLRPAGAPVAVLKRVATAVVFIPLFVWLVTRAPAWLFVLFVLGVSTAALGELWRMFEREGQPTYARLGVATGAAITVGFAAPSAGMVPVVPAVVLSVSVGVLLSAPLWTRNGHAIEPVALTLLGVLYVSWFLGHVLALRRLADGADLVLFLVGVTWVGESAAYVVGSTVGRRRLAPVVSPRKTVEGAGAQLVVSLLAGLGLGVWLLPEWTAVRALLAGGLLGVAGQIGDLAESVMKRRAGVKDTGGLIPGHGGVLDRIDGLLFNVPAFYYYVILGGGA